MVNKTKYLKIILILAVLCISQNPAFAVDTIPTQIPDLEEQVDITMSPKFPEPEQQVTITLDAYGIDLNTSSITWTSNGQTVLQGQGEKVLKINAGRQGQIITIKAIVNAPSSKPVEKTITINPQTIDIAWEAYTYTPPFYKGKAMFTPQENVKFVAMPGFANSRNTTYKWTQDGEVMGSRSGFGKNTFLYTGSILMKPVEVVIDATSDGQTAQKFTAIAPVDAEVYLYEKNSLYGTMFNREISTLYDLGARQEGAISIYPFFFGVDNRQTGQLSYAWTINGIPIDVPSYQNDMTFRNTENIDGKSAIGISVSNDDNFLQSVQKSTLINFNKANSGFSF